MKLLIFIIGLMFALPSLARHSLHTPESEFKLELVDSSMASEYRVVGIYLKDCNYIQHSFRIQPIRGPLHLVDLAVSSTRKLCHGDEFTPVELESPWFSIPTKGHLELIVPTNFDLELR